MDEDYVADAQTADVGKDGPSSSPQQNTSGENTLTSSPKNSAAPTAPGHVASPGNVDASMHAPLNKGKLPLNASTDMEGDDASPDDQIPDPVVTLAITRDDFQAVAAPNAAPETLKKFTTNKTLIEAVNNLFLETYESYTERARMTGSGDAKRLVIHFQTAEARDIHLFSRPNAKVQQARIVYDNADSIARFTDQWAVYCFSTCLRVTPCAYTVDQKAARRQFVATLTQLPPNVKDINLAPLTRNLGAKAVNVPLSLNSYKPKRWAYVTFNSQETMDAAMEQTISFQGKVLSCGFPDNSNKLCHRCGKLGCAPNFCPEKQTRGRSRTRNPVAKLKERFNVNQPRRSAPDQRANSNSRSHSRSKSRDRSAFVKGRNNGFNSNKGQPNPTAAQGAQSRSKERSVSFSSSSRVPTRPLPRQTPNSALSVDDANNILNLLRELQQEVATFHKRVSALELADARMTRIESHLGLDPITGSLVHGPDPDLMQDDVPISHIPLQLQPSSKSTPAKSILTHSKAPSTNTASPVLSKTSSLFPSAPSFTPTTSTQDEINDFKNSRTVIESKLDMIAGHVEKFINSIGGTPTDKADSASSV
ncbi:unnamed protein product [Rhizophagus irregularis]|nr:unnamed protein product [Rhizophagus irregularis]